MAKDKRNLNEKVMDEFNLDNSADATKGYNNIKKAYEDIEKFYRAKIKNEDFDIKIEKIRIENKLGKYETKISKLGFSYIIMIFGNIFYFMLQSIFQYMNYNRTLNLILDFISLISILIIVLRSVGKDVNKENPKGIMLNVSLKVLDELKKENPNLKNNEVAATSEDEIGKKNNRRDDRVIKGLINIVTVKK